jgi:hypothetical protein
VIQSLTESRIHLIFELEVNIWLVILLEIGLHPGRAQEVSLFVGRLNDIMTSTNESWRTAAKEALNDPKIDVGTIVDALGTIVRGPIDRFLKRYSP